MLKKLVRRIIPGALMRKVTYARSVSQYHREIAAKEKRLSKLPSIPRADGPEPSVTVCITNSNNSGPLELTLRTAIATAGYDNYRIVVADNKSTDGSVEMLQSLDLPVPIELLTDRAMKQHLWYDHFLATVETDYWVGIHEDLIFLGNGWLADLINYLEANPKVDLLGGEYFPPVIGPEPVSGELVELRESLSTWIFAVRTELRDRINTSFAFHKYWDETEKRTVSYDQGGKLMEDMRAAGLGFDCLPDWYLNKWQHLANVTWAFDLDSVSSDRRAFKLYQIRDVEKRLEKLRKSE